MSAENIYENRRYLIFPASQLNLVDFNDVLETSSETVRKSLDGTQTFVKWNGNTPEFVTNLTNTQGPYTHDEMLQILSTPNWV